MLSSDAKPVVLITSNYSSTGGGEESSTNSKTAEGNVKC